MKITKVTSAQNYVLSDLNKGDILSTSIGWVLVGTIHQNSIVLVELNSGVVIEDYTEIVIFDLYKDYKLNVGHQLNSNLVPVPSISINPGEVFITSAGSIYLKLDSSTASDNFCMNLITYLVEDIYTEVRLLSDVEFSIK